MKYLLMLVLFLSGNIYAEVTCHEKVNALIVHDNGKVYFMTDQTCTQGWCQVNWTQEDNKNRAYSMLLAARTTDRLVSFRWSALNSCSDSNVVNASPSYFYF